MEAIRLDYNSEKAETVIMSNDAYYYLAFNEPCLDDSNVEEANEIKGRFPHGFKIGPDIENMATSGQVKCQIIPICENSKSPFTHYRIDGTWFKDEFYYNEDKSKVHYRIYNGYDKRFLDFGWNDVQLNQYGKPEIKTENGSILPLWGKSWVKY